MFRPASRGRGSRVLHVRGDARKIAEHVCGLAFGHSNNHVRHHGVCSELVSSCRRRLQHEHGNDPGFKLICYPRDLWTDEHFQEGSRQSPLLCFPHARFFHGQDGRACEDLYLVVDGERR